MLPFEKNMPKTHESSALRNFLVVHRKSGATHPIAICYKLIALLLLHLVEPFGKAALLVGGGVLFENSL